MGEYTLKQFSITPAQANRTLSLKPVTPSYMSRFLKAALLVREQVELNEKLRSYNYTL